MTEKKQGAAEWLRKWARIFGSADAYSCKKFMADEFGVSCSRMRCTDCNAVIFERIADRIESERELPEGVEWPRFEDGELVKVGDEVEFEGKTMRVCEVALDADGWVLWCENDGLDGRLRGSYGERVKRPVPKVLAADGAPIEVGDVVYYDGEPHPLTVVGITRDGKDALVDANGEESCVEGGRPQDFSHDAPKPVLDADGVPIKVGDTVYCDGSEPTLTVIRLFEDATGATLADCNDLDGMYYTVVPSRLTHERPDSWERLEEDAAKRVCEYAGAQKSTADPDRYSCIECPYDDLGPHTDAECNERMRLDLVRRAKALAKAGE